MKKAGGISRNYLFSGLCTTENIRDVSFFNFLAPNNLLEADWLNSAACLGSLVYPCFLLLKFCVLKRQRLSKADRPKEVVVSSSPLGS